MARYAVHSAAGLVPKRLGRWLVREALAHLPLQEARPLNLGRVFSGERPLVVELPVGVKMALHLDDHIERRIYYTNGYEAAVEHLLKRCLERAPGDVFDVGANSGIYALIAARLRRDRGAVHAFEPFPETFARLRRNRALNPELVNLHLHPEAVAAAPGCIALGGVAGNLGETSAARTQGPTTLVRCVSLDDLLQESPRESVALVKIDVEGAEVLVLDGMKRTLSRGVCAHLLIEMHPPEIESLGGRPEAVCERLDEAGYELFTIEDDRLCRLDRTRFFASSVGHRFIFAALVSGWGPEPMPKGF